MRPRWWRAGAALLLSLSLTTEGWAANAFVQYNEVKGLFPGVDRATVTLTGVVTGNLLACGLGWSPTTSTFVSFGDGTNTYTAVDQFNGGGGTNKSMYAKNVTGGTLAIEAIWSATVTSYSLICHEVSGADTSAPLDKSSTGNQLDPTCATDAVTTGSQTTTTNGQYIWGWAWSIGGTVLTAGTNFTIRENDTGWPNTEDQIQASAGSVAATFTCTVTSTFVSLMMTFKEAAAAAAGGGALLLLGVGR
jgi:hypothetical protein